MPTMDSGRSPVRRSRGVDVALVLVVVGLVAVSALITVIVADPPKATRTPTVSGMAPPSIELPDPPAPVLPSAGEAITTSPASPRTDRPRAIGASHTPRPPATRPTAAAKPRGKIPA